jgi:hypothetical protein
MPLAKPPDFRTSFEKNGRKKAQEEQPKAHHAAEDLIQDSNGQKIETPRDSDESIRSMGSINSVKNPAGPPSKPPSNKQEAIRDHEEQSPKP